MTVHQIYAMKDGISIGSCGHRHRSRVTAEECPWRPTNEAGEPLAFDRLISFSSERGPVAGIDRGAVSVSGSGFELIKAGSEQLNMSMSQLVEEACEPVLAEFFGSPTRRGTRLSEETRRKLSERYRERTARSG